MVVVNTGHGRQDHEMTERLDQSIGLTEQQERKVREWADRTQYVKAVRLFGSRAKGCAKPHSDVDLAVTADAGHYVALAAKWEAELAALLGLTVRIGDFARNKAIRDASEECNRDCYSNGGGHDLRERWS